MRKSNFSSRFQNSKRAPATMHHEGLADVDAANPFVYPGITKECFMRAGFKATAACLQLNRVRSSRVTEVRGSGFSAHREGEFRGTIRPTGQEGVP